MLSFAVVAMLMQSTPPLNCEKVERYSDAWAACLDEVIARAKARPTAGTVLFRELSKMKGKGQQHAFDRLGYPDRQMKIDDKTVFIWERREPDDLTCTIKVIARAKLVVDTDFNGNEGACAYFARRLDLSFSSY